MRITKLNLTNYRGARSLSLEFDPKLNVFYGENGAGKTTVLDGIVVAFSDAIAFITQYLNGPRVDVIEITPNDITYFRDSASVQLSCEADNEIIECLFKDGNLSDEDRATLVAGYLEKDTRGMFGAYWTTVSYLRQTLGY